MIYDEYEIYKNKYYNAQREYDKILSEKEILFNRTQPKATKYDKEIVGGGVPSNSFEEYVIALQEKMIDERLKEAKSIMEDRGQLVKLKEQELRLSNNIHDKVYCYRILDRMKIYKIMRLIGYEEAQTNRIIKAIKENIKMIEKDSFYMK